MPKALPEVETRRRTRQNGAEGKLRAVEKFFQTFMTYSFAAAWVTDRDGVITYASPAYIRMFPIGDPTHQNVRNLFPKHLAAEYLRNNQQVLDERRTLEIIERGPRADGTLGEFLVFKFPMQGEDGVWRAGGVAIDVTAQRQSEMAKLESDDRLRLALQTARMGIWEWHPVEGTTVWSDEVYDLLEIPRDTPAGEELEIYNARIHPEDREPLWQSLNQAVQTGTRYRSEIRYILHDGTIRWLTSLGQLYPDGEGKTPKMVGTVVDTTSEKHREESLNQQQIEIAHLSRVASIGEMASSLTHELSQPLTSILSYGSACLMAARADEKNEPQLKVVRCLEGLLSEARRAVQITRRLRAFIRKQVPYRQKTDLNAAVRESVELMKFEFRKADILPQLVLSADPVIASVDEIQIQQVVINLLRNAIDAMETVPPGQRRLAVKTELIDNDAIRIAVIDSGIGVSADQIHRLFESFYTTKPTGLGLGLPICRSIIESHGGVLFAQRNNDAGMTFQFCIKKIDAYFIAGGISHEGRTRGLHRR